MSVLDTSPRERPRATSGPRPAAVARLCDRYIKGFFHPGTRLMYGARINGESGVDALESPAEVRAGRVRGEHRPWGYGSGIEDLAYHNGMLLYALCEAFDATDLDTFGDLARQIAGGMLGMARLSPVRGFVPRGPHPDGQSYYPDSSLDQHTLYVAGLWRFSRSPLCDRRTRGEIAGIVDQILARFEQTRWAFLNEAGTAASHAGGDMLRMTPDRAVVLLMMLATARDLTGSERWASRYEELGNEQQARRWALVAEPPDVTRLNRYNMFNNQDVLRTHVLGQLETGDRRRALRARVRVIAGDMVTCRFFEAFQPVFLASEYWEPPHKSREAADEYLRPLGESMASTATLTDLWEKFDHDRLSPPMIFGRSNRYEPITLATPAMSWQVAFLTGDPELETRARAAVDDMLARVDLDRVDLGWAACYAALAALHSVAPLDPVSGTLRTRAPTPDGLPC